MPIPKFDRIIAVTCIVDDANYIHHRLCLRKRQNNTRTMIKITGELWIEIE